MVITKTGTFGGTPWRKSEIAYSHIPFEFRTWVEETNSSEIGVTWNYERIANWISV